MENARGNSAPCHRCAEPGGLSKAREAVQWFFLLSLPALMPEVKPLLVPCLAVRDQTKVTGLLYKYHGNGAFQPLFTRIRSQVRKRKKKKKKALNFFANCQRYQGPFSHIDFLVLFTLQQ